MKSLPTLIKLCQTQIEDRRKRLTEREEQKSSLEAILDELERQMKEERDLITKNPSMAMTFEAFNKMYQEQKENTNYAIADIKRQILHLTEDVAELYMDKKKFEILLERQASKEAKKLAKKEEDELNEVALRKFSYDSDEII